MRDGEWKWNEALNCYFLQQVDPVLIHYLKCDDDKSWDENWSFHWQKRQSIIGLFCSRNLAKETINLLQILEMHLLRLYLRIARRGYHCCCGKQNINLPLPKLCLHCLIFIDSNLTFRLELFKHDRLELTLLEFSKSGKTFTWNFPFPKTQSNFKVYQRTGCPNKFWTGL